MRTIIAGGREFSDSGLMLDSINELEWDISQVVCGLARGADLMGKTWAEGYDVSVAEYPAKWKELGRKAGPLRNIEMSENADALLAFWDGESKGTKHMIDQATKKGLKVKVIRYETKPQGLAPLP
jgi:hypothetical protein